MILEELRTRSHTRTRLKRNETYHETFDIDGRLGAVSEGQRLRALRDTHARVLAALPPLEHARVDLPEQLEQPARRGGDGLVAALAVLDEVPEEVLLHRPRLAAADLADRVDARGDDLAADARVHELVRELAHDGRERVRGRELVRGLRERDEDRGDAQLVVGEVLHDVRVEAEHAELVPAHHAREELHEEDLVVERKALVVLVQHVVELLAESLGVVEQLDRRKVGVRSLGLLFLLLWTR